MPVLHFIAVLLLYMHYAFTNEFRVVDLHLYLQTSAALLPAISYQQDDDATSSLYITQHRDFLPSLDVIFSMFGDKSQKMLSNYHLSMVHVFSAMYNLVPYILKA